MNLDISTLLFADSFVTAMSGLLLFLAVFQNRDMAGAAWWGVANLCIAAGTAVLAVRHGLQDFGWRILVAVLLSLAGGFYWGAARRCHSAVVPVTPVIAGTAFWFILLALPQFRGAPSLQMAFVIGGGALYSYAAAVEMWAGRAERLSARWPLMALLMIDGTISAVGGVEAYLGDLSALRLPPLTSWYGLIYFETFMLTVGGASFVILFARERAELVQQSAARIDVLTGVPNRRAFMDHGHQAVAEAIGSDGSLSLVLFDLDHFKSVNDVYGHATGDAVLVRFAEVARRMQRAGDMMGRIGGEEFALVLPGATAGEGYAVAERIRVAFAESCHEVNGCDVSATVSAGVAMAHPGSTLDSLLSEADERLYRAKMEGRNQVMAAAEPGQGGVDEAAARVA